MDNSDLQDTHNIVWRRKVGVPILHFGDSPFLDRHKGGQTLVVSEMEEECTAFDRPTSLFP
jgi:hypothetical protein